MIVVDLTFSTGHYSMWGQSRLGGVKLEKCGGEQWYKVGTNLKGWTRRIPFPSDTVSTGWLSLNRILMRLTVWTLKPFTLVIWISTSRKGNMYLHRLVCFNNVNDEIVSIVCHREISLPLVWLLIQECMSQRFSAPCWKCPNWWCRILGSVW